VVSVPWIDLRWGLSFDLHLRNSWPWLTSYKCTLRNNDRVSAHRFRIIRTCWIIETNY